MCDDEDRTVAHIQLPPGGQAQIQHVVYTSRRRPHPASRGQAQIQHVVCTLFSIQRLQVPFATCDDEDYAAANIQPLEGKPVKLQVAQGAVMLTPAATGKSAAAAAATASKGATTGKPAGEWAVTLTSAATGKSVAAAAGTESKGMTPSKPAGACLVQV
eukprot:783171-Pelagomonas_calceolata.AAC.10